MRISKRTYAVTNHLLSGNRSEKYLYVSHHKCATQYVINILKAVADLNHLPGVKCDWRRKITAAELLLNKFILIQDYSSDIIELTRIKGRGFHVIRDPRDILVSMYFSHKKSHIVRDPKAHEILDNRKILNEISEEEGLKYLLDHSAYFNRITTEMAGWDYSRENFLELKYEDLISDPFSRFKAIFSFLGVKIEDPQLKNILERFSFQRLKKEVKGADKTVSHYRKGRPGDWENHFTPDLKKIFKSNYNDLLLKLAYIEDVDW
ncbi:MAG: sulfotransferase domain-containing protein [FCB group bacterium]|nr:sulfotransferase domain-containing protein [FCB group bacterium]